MRFKEVIGQQKLKSDLIRAALADKISHAQLFSGQAGYGTLPLALAYTQFLFCKQKQKDDSCGECASCQKVEKLQHPDLHFVFPIVPNDNSNKPSISDDFISDWREQIRENPYFNLVDWTKKIDVKERKAVIRVDESKEILRKLSLKSFEGSYKIMLIWNPEEMNTACSNKLLKILEEPPAQTLFLLEAVANLIAAGIDVRLVIIGGGPLWKKIRKQSSNLPVEMLGYIANRKKVAEYLASADVAIAPGPLETFCLSALESLASGTPVVASASSAVGEILDITSTNPAGAVAKDNGASFANEINKLLRDSSLRITARKQAELYSWTNTVHKMLELHGAKQPMVVTKRRLRVA